MPDLEEVCYLCNKPIDPKATDEVNRPSEDHVPPLVFFPKKMRKKIKDQLVKLPAHQGCNSKYTKDEEYFARAMGYYIRDHSEAGAALYEDFKGHLARHPNHAGVVGRILKKVSRRLPSGLLVPPTHEVLEFESERNVNVILKIARGLYYEKFRKSLPENHRFDARKIEVDDPWPEGPKSLIDKAQIQGAYPDVFEYKYGYRSETPKVNFIWIRLWKTLLFVIRFDDADCECPGCKEIYGV
jgi:hypothetical protein